MVILLSARIDLVDFEYIIYCIEEQLKSKEDMRRAYYLLLQTVSRE